MADYYVAPAPTWTPWDPVTFPVGVAGREATVETGPPVAKRWNPDTSTWDVIPAP